MPSAGKLTDSGPLGAIPLDEHLLNLLQDSVRFLIFLDRSLGESQFLCNIGGQLTVFELVLWSGRMVDKPRVLQ
jgi:hypothetical protein